jgi:hypothetical protein
MGAVVLASCKSNTISSSESNSTTIGPQGGVALGPDGSALRVPANALAQGVSFTIRVADPAEYPSLSGYNSDGKVYAFEPHQSFLTPATVVVPFGIVKPAAGAILSAEPGDSKWTELSVTATDSNALETSVTALSYFVVVDKGGGGEGGETSCSGRGPMAGQSNGTLTNMSGVLPATFFPPNGHSVDTATLQSGMAGPVNAIGNFFTLTLADFTNACGWAKNNDSKIGGSMVTITLQGVTTPSIQTYTSPGTQIMVSGSYLDSATPPGVCSGHGGNDAPSSVTQTVNITASDSTHVTGTYDVFAVNGTVELKGTFDLPACTIDNTITPSCCIP